MALLASPAALPAAARDNSRDQEAAYRLTREGKIMPLRMIERRIVPRMRGATYLGPELDPVAAVYRLKFMRDGQIIWVDVDARSGRVLRTARGR
ncbi:MAG: PepSY domain-containing protein [Sphingomonadaceae bacterium]